MSEKQRKTFGTNLGDILTKAGIDKLPLTPNKQPSPKIIETEQIDKEFLKNLTSTMQRLQSRGLAMPFLHITSKAVTTKNLNTVKTGFDDNIKAEGLKMNTSGATFVSKPVGEPAKIESPSYFCKEPADFLDDLYQILTKYTFHGIRTNRMQQKALVGSNVPTGSTAQRYLENGMGQPIMVVVDITGTKLQKEIDGEEHYVTKENISAHKIIGIVDLDQIFKDTQKLMKFYFNEKKKDLLMDKDTLLIIAADLLSQINEYLKKIDKRNNKEEARRTIKNIISN